MEIRLVSQVHTLNTGSITDCQILLPCGCGKHNEIIKICTLNINNFIFYVYIVVGDIYNSPTMVCELFLTMRIYYLGNISFRNLSLILCAPRVHILKLCANDFSCALLSYIQNLTQFPNSVFSLTDFFLPFSLLSLCSGYPEYSNECWLKYVCTSGAHVRMVTEMCAPGTELHC